MSSQVREGFWKEALSIQNSATPLVAQQVAIFGIIAATICAFSLKMEALCKVRLALVITPHEIAGAALGLLLVFRTNASYDRWWEARKLWGGLVDRCRNLSINAMAYGPNDLGWRKDVVNLVAAYPQVVRHTLRHEQPAENLKSLLGEERLAKLMTSDHMPSFIALMLGDLLQTARDRFGMDGFAFLQIDRERVLLIDNFGGCERILNTPTPKVYSIVVRRLIFVFLITLPFALLHQLGSEWLVPAITMLVAYPLLSLDQIGVELENPFRATNLSALPIIDMSTLIDRNVHAILDTKNTDKAVTK
jgi:putative membrane protein